MHHKTDHNITVLRGSLFLPFGTPLQGRDASFATIAVLGCACRQLPCHALLHAAHTQEAQSVSVYKQHGYTVVVVVVVIVLVEHTPACLLRTFEEGG